MKNVIISIKSSQKIDGLDVDGIELVTDGSYSYENGAASFEYMESELTGFEGTKTEFKIEKDTVTISREGVVGMDMFFSEGQKHYFMYNTEHGALSMSVDTKRIETELDESGGHIEIHYIVDIDNSVVSRNSFSINIREA